MAGPIKHKSKEKDPYKTAITLTVPATKPWERKRSQLLDETWEEIANASQVVNDLEAEQNELNDRLAHIERHGLPAAKSLVVTIEQKINRLNSITNADEVLEFLEIFKEEK